MPVDPVNVDDFDPEQVPTVGQLLRELDAAAAQRREENGGNMEVDGEAKDKEMRSGTEIAELGLVLTLVVQIGRRPV